MAETNALVAAIAADLTNRWEPTFPFEASKLQHNPPMATLYVDRMLPTRSDQGLGLGIWDQIDVVLRYYVSFKQREKAAQKQIRDGVDALLAVLSTDCTLSNAVEHVEMSEGGAEIRVDLDEQLLIAEITLEVAPWPTQ